MIAMNLQQRTQYDARRSGVRTSLSTGTGPIEIAQKRPLQTFLKIRFVLTAIGLFVGLIAFITGTQQMRTSDQATTLETSQGAVSYDESMRKLNLSIIEVNLSGYYYEKRTFPTHAQFADEQWRKENMPAFQKNLLKRDSTQDDYVLASSPDANHFWYIASNGQAVCDGGVTTVCNNYILGVRLNDGTDYTRTDAR